MFKDKLPPFRYVISRMFQAFFVLLVVVAMTFVLLRIVPGDPAILMLGESSSEKSIAKIHETLGLSQPFYLQYFSYLIKILRFDFGQSFFSNQSVYKLIFGSFLITAKIAGIAFLISFVLGITIGVLSAIWRGKWQEKILSVITSVLMSTPAFWIAILLQIIFGLRFKILPISGISSPFWYILPCLTLSLRSLAITARYTRSEVAVILNEEYVKTERSLGFSEMYIIFKHVLKNALIAILTFSGMQFGSLLTSSVLVESVFSIPGIGRLTLNSISNRDIPLIQGCMIYIALVFITINLLIDIVSYVINPRIRVSERRL